MKTGLKTGLFTLAFAVLASCGSDDADASGINTADVKGDIDLMGENGHSLNLNNNGEESKAYQIEIGETAELTIFPSSVTFEEEKEKIEKEVESSFSNVKIISSTADCVYFKEVKKPFMSDGDEKTGYSFVRVVKKDDKTNYILESSGESPMDPIWSKKEADKLLKIAKSFKPKS
ncbi:MAG: hypothetical protein HRT57_02980 [Crocinitomicaceae bacterium]|nr:hypothetical protein [Crocinitomicaceae bacterium]